MTGTLLPKLLVGGVDLNRRFLTSIQNIAGFVQGKQRLLNSFLLKLMRIIVSIVELP
jgi:hypothetical protein